MKTGFDEESLEGVRKKQFLKELDTLMLSDVVVSAVTDIQHKSK